MGTGGSIRKRTNPTIAELLDPRARSHHGCLWTTALGITYFYNSMSSTIREILATLIRLEQRYVIDIKHL